MTEVRDRLAHADIGLGTFDHCSIVAVVSPKRIISPAIPDFEKLRKYQTRMVALIMIRWRTIDWPMATFNL
jgi:hypothetical protein